MWQEIIVFGCVAVALLFVLRKYWPTASRQGSRITASAVASHAAPATDKAGHSACGACRGCSGGGCH